MDDYGFIIKCKRCGNEDVKPCLLPDIMEIGIFCGMCFNEGLYDCGLDNDVFDEEGN